MLASLSAGSAGAMAHPHGRRLLAEPEHCSVRPWEQHGGVVLYALGIVYMVLGLVIINNHYFMPSLRRLSHRLRLSDDVAGATIFAGGSSAPFVFFGFFSLLAPSSAIPSAAGIASAVGAGNTNVLGVLGAAGALCMAADAPDSSRRLPAYPLLRDAGCWAVTILVLGGIFADGKVHWWEGLIMVALYCAYVGLNAANLAIIRALDACAAARKAAMRPKLPSQHGEAAAHMQDSAMDIADTEPESAGKCSQTDSHLPTQSATPAHSHGSPVAAAAANSSRQQRQTPAAAAASASSILPAPAGTSDGRTGTAAGGVAAAAAGRATLEREAQATPEQTPMFPHLRPPGGRWRRACWLVCLPWYLGLAATVPDCRAPRLAKWYAATAVLATAWVGVDSWFLLLWTLKVGCVAKVPLTVMGATVLAIGSTMLTALVSFVVAHQGKADMSVANALGSNVFNVLIGLGLPYFVVQAARGYPAVVDTASLWPDVGCLLVGLACFLLLAAATRLRLTRAVGYALLGLYVGYIVYEVLMVWVFNVFSTRSP